LLIDLGIGKFDWWSILTGILIMVLALWS